MVKRSSGDMQSHDLYIFECHRVLHCFGLELTAHVICLTLQYYFTIASEQVETPSWIFNFELGDLCPWQHCPSMLLPPCCVPVAARDHSHAIASSQVISSNIVFHFLRYFCLVRSSQPNIVFFTMILTPRFLVKQLPAQGS